jgi:hypothetical protein
VIVKTSRVITSCASIGVSFEIDRGNNRPAVERDQQI